MASTGAVSSVAWLLGTGVATVWGGLASAHVILAPAQAPAGSYYAGVLRVGHGCAGSPTTALRVEPPAGVITLKPQPKPGWTLEIEREPLAVPLAEEGGRPITQRVKAVTWRGRLADDQFDDFGVMAKLPTASGRLAFPVIQTCESGVSRWTEVAPAGLSPHALPHPAPTLTLTAAGPAGGMATMPGMDHK